jgi:hypothetical protein
MKPEDNPRGTRGAAEIEVARHKLSQRREEGEKKSRNENPKSILVVIVV